MEPIYAARSTSMPPCESDGAPRAADAGKAMRRTADSPGLKTSDVALWTALLGAPALTASELAAVVGLAHTREVAAGQPVLSRSDKASSLVALLCGEVALGLRTVAGTFRTERILRGPAWLDLSSAWLEDTHMMDAQAMVAAVIIELPCRALQAQLAEHPALAERLIRGLSREVLGLAVNTHELMHKDAPARLAQWLHQRCEPLAGNAGQAEVKLCDRKRDVASQLAITPETLSRLMRSFSRQGVIEVSGYNVRVLDPQALQKLAQA